MNRRAEITAVILAGGMGRRMGGQDKGLVELDGEPLILHVIRALEPQVGEVLINANRNLHRYADFGHAVVRDDLEGFQGPLAGMLSAMRRAQTPLLLTVPCDAPLLPGDLAARLATDLREQDARIAVAHDGRRLQPVHALMETALADDLEAFLASGERKIDRWYARHPMSETDFSDRPETFVNVNTLEELGRLANEREASS